MKLTVIVPTHNRPDLLHRMLQSLEAATPARLAWELLVVDNNTAVPLRPELERVLAATSLPVRHLSEPVRGKSRALNRAIQEARAAVVAFLDDDVVVHKDYLTGIENTLATSRYRVFGGRVLAAWPSTPPVWVTGGRPLVTSRGPIVVHDYGAEPRVYDITMRRPIGCNFFCYRSLFEHHGLFNVRLGPGAGPGLMGGEENELLKRFQDAAETILYTPLVVIDHPVDPTRMTKAYFRRRLFWAGRSVPYLARRPSRSLFGIPRYLYRELGVTVARGLGAALTGRRLRAFDRQLDTCELVGAMYEYWRLSRGGR